MAVTAPRPMLTDGMITVQIPDRWIVGPLFWDPDICDEGFQQVAHPEGLDVWQLSAWLGRLEGFPPEAMADVLTVFFQTQLPQPPTIAAVTEQRRFTTGGLAAISFTATLDPRMLPFWPEPGFIVDVIIVDASLGKAPSPDLLPDARWLATIRRIGDSHGETSLSTIRDSLVVAP